MKKTFDFRPQGVCSRNIEITLENGKIDNVAFTGGCGGNTQGISALVKGKDAGDIAKCLEGIKCGMKDTSCPDQLSKALSQYLSENGES